MQALSDLHIGRDRRSFGFEPHPLDRPPDPAGVQGQPVHHRVAEGGHVQPRKLIVQGEVRRRDEQGGGREVTWYVWLFIFTKQCQGS